MLPTLGFGKGGRHRSPQAVEQVSTQIWFHLKFARAVARANLIKRQKILNWITATNWGAMNRHME
jgi:hypothetical protein